MIIDVWVELPSGRGQVLRALIDTGAEVNLVREGIFPQTEFSFANQRLNLTTANGQPMRGGNLSLKAKLYFSRYQGREFLEECTLPAEFYQADIAADAILGCPWLKRQRLGIFPYLGTLSVERDDFHLDMLASDVPPRPKTKKRGKRRRKSQVGVNTIAITPEDSDEEEGFDWIETINWKYPAMSELS